MNLPTALQKIIQKSQKSFTVAIKRPRMMFTYTQHRLTIMLMFSYTLPSFFEDCVAIIVPLRLRNEFFSEQSIQKVFWLFGVIFREAAVSAMSLKIFWLFCH